MKRMTLKALRIGVLIISNTTTATTWVASALLSFHSSASTPWRKLSKPQERTFFTVFVTGVKTTHTV